MTASLAVNGVLVVLLIATLVYLFRLQTGLAAIRDSQQELEGQIARLGDATTRAENALHQLRAGSLEVSDRLQERTRTGRTLANELEIAISAAQRLSEKLDGTLNQARPVRMEAAPPRSPSAERLKGVR